MTPMSPRFILWESLLPLESLGLSSLKVGVTPKSPLFLHVGSTALTTTTSDHEVTLSHVHLTPQFDNNPHLPYLSRGQ